MIIKGRIPSKKNSTWTIMVKGRSIRLPSDKYKQWHKEASLQLKGQEKLPENLDYLELTFYFPDNRRTDLTNKAESVMDLLVDNGFIQDDSWQVIPHLRLQCKGIDKENPRVEIDWF